MRVYVGLVRQFFLLESVAKIQWQMRVTKDNAGLRTRLHPVRSLILSSYKNRMKNIQMHSITRAVHVPQRISASVSILLGGGGEDGRTRAFLGQ